MSHDRERLLRSDTETTGDVSATWLAWNRLNDSGLGRTPTHTSASTQSDLHQENSNDDIAVQPKVGDEDITDYAQSSLHQAVQESNGVRRQIDNYDILEDSPLPDSVPMRSIATERDVQTLGNSPKLLPYQGTSDDDLVEIFEPVGELPTLPKLDFKPFILQNWTLVIIITFYSAQLAGLVTLLYYQNSDRIFHVHSTASRFTIRILPSLLGTLSAMVFQSMVTNYARILPYIVMARAINPQDRCDKAKKTLLAANYPLVNIIQAWENGHYVLCVAMATIVLCNGFITPTKSTLIRKTPSLDDPDSWEVTISAGAAKYLLFNYTLILGLTLTIFMYLRKRRTGLRWDPVSIADQIMLLQGSDILDDFSGMEYSSRSISFMRKTELFERLKNKRYRLGYWRHQSTDRYWYGVRRWPECFPETDDQDHPRSQWAEGASAPSLLTHETEPVGRPQIVESLEQPAADGLTVHRAQSYTAKEFPSIADRSPEAIAWWRARCKEVLDDPGRCYSKVYFWISDYLATVVYCIVVASLGSCVWIVATDRVSTGLIYPDTEFNTTYFIITFVPTFWLGLINNFWHNADIWYRQLQMYMGLRQPTEAKENLLLGYPCDLPVMITIKALGSCHWRLALTSAMPLVHRLAQVLAGSLFSVDMTSHPNQYRILIDQRQFFTVFGILCSYLVLIPVVWPGPDRRLPVTPLCIADPITLFYDSTLVRNRNFLPRRMDEERWHMKYRLCLAERKYGFGIYPGRYGALHVGIDDAFGYDEDKTGLRFIAPLRPPTRAYRRWLKAIWIQIARKFDVKRQPTWQEDELEALQRLHTEVLNPQATTTAVEITR